MGSPYADDGPWLALGGAIWGLGLDWVYLRLRKSSVGRRRSRMYIKNICNLGSAIDG